MRGSRLLVAGLAVLGLAGAGCAASAPAGRPAGSRASPASAARLPAGRSGTPSSAPAAAAGPAGLRPVLVAPVSARVVYVLAEAARITGSSAPVLFRSEDAGRQFRLVGTPVARWPLTGRPMSVSELWFVNPADGYALVGGWGQRRPLMVTALRAHRNEKLR